MGVYRYTCTRGIAIRLTLDVEMNKLIATLYHYKFVDNVNSIQSTAVQTAIVVSTLLSKLIIL